MENSSNGTQSEELKTHPYLAGSGKAVNTAVYSVSELSSTEIKIGYMDSMAAQLASLTLLKGAMPQNNDEIAVERHTLETLGYSEELGQTITVSYPDKNNKTSIYEKQLAVRNIRRQRTGGLCGILGQRKLYAGHACYADRGGKLCADGIGYNALRT